MQERRNTGSGPQTEGTSQHPSPPKSVLRTVLGGADYSLDLQLLRSTILPDTLSWASVKPSIKRPIATATFGEWHGAECTVSSGNASQGEQDGL